MKLIWIGIDDTDSVAGGCTTYVACCIIKKLSGNFSIIGYPRLVRLNPNIPWKTRGNGAIALQIGKSNTKTIPIANFNDKIIFAAHKLEKQIPETEKKEIQKIVTKIVKSLMKTEDANTNPGIVFLDKQPPNTLYKKTVKKIVDIKEITTYLTKKEATYIGYKNKRGLIGATASIAWKPNDITYELIAYRHKKKWGTKRSIDIKSVKQMDVQVTSTFDNYDYANNHNRIAPNSPCPILYGIRGDKPSDLIKAQTYIESEPYASWVLFTSNQGTDDHLQKKKIHTIHPFESTIVYGTITKPPTTIHGGHVIFTLQDTTGTIDCAAYEPTKEFRTIVRQLTSNDIIEVHGGVRKKPLTINLEKINIKYLHPIIEKVENPVCPHCGKHMKSRGTNQGFKCIRCKTITKIFSCKEKKRNLHLGFYEVPVCARRHLSKPLKRIKQNKHTT